jgi:hypothetical protein
MQENIVKYFYLFFFFIYIIRDHQEKEENKDHRAQWDQKEILVMLGHQDFKENRVFRDHQEHQV